MNTLQAGLRIIPNTTWKIGLWILTRSRLTVAAERPKSYRRIGDTKIYDKNLIDIKSDGIYRSIHYIVKYMDTMVSRGWNFV